MKDNKKYILCGMYDKTCVPHEKTKLYSGIIPEKTIKVGLESDDMGYGCVFSRDMFPYKKSNGEEQNYYGWYILIPVDIELLSLNENLISNMDIDYVRLKNNKGGDMILNKDGVKYKVYGKFNVAKTSDNWSLKILTI